MPFPLDRRAFLHTGLAAVGAAMFMPGRRGLANNLFAAPPLQSTGAYPLWTPLAASDPILRIPDSVAAGAGTAPAHILAPALHSIGGIPFVPAWFGDVFGPETLPFHASESPADWASVEDRTDVAIIGGGLSGMTAAHHLRGRDFVLFDLRPRFGGYAMGERWKHLPYSLGSAYFMVPDDGDDFDRLYSDIGVYDTAQVDTGKGFQLEFGGEILTDLCQHCSREEVAALRSYQAAVQFYANEAYPDIPWGDRRARTLVRALDTMTFEASVAQACGGVVPPMLARAVQAYCYSSFGVGWGDLSAAAGWNFIAAEEFGRIVLPGGNAGLAHLLWQSIAQVPACANGRPRLRAGCLVSDVKLVGQGAVIAWRDAQGGTHTLGARSVVFAGAKHIVRHVMPSLATLDPEKWEAMHGVPTAAYVVANVHLNRAVGHDFYDMFAIHDGAFPMDGNAFELDRRITDAVNGTFAVARAHPHSDVLTLYWPLPWHSSRFTIVHDVDWQAYAELAAPQIRRLLRALDVPATAVAGVRLARWGHAMPYARAGTYQGDHCELLRRPVAERLWFANQDNWLLPAVETCLGEAKWVSKNIR